ncbi:MAG: hypothetical protein KDD55_01665, partial [Bdellovibrionales bacterium]|nr:hypothetical protein [Bdellovibrionales bacterium]
VCRVLGEVVFYWIISPFLFIFFFLPIAAFFFVLFAPVSGPIAGFYLTQRAHGFVSKLFGGLRWA